MKFAFLFLFYFEYFKKMLGSEKFVFISTENIKLCFLNVKYSIPVIIIKILILIFFPINILIYVGISDEFTQ